MKNTLGQIVLALVVICTARSSNATAGDDESGVYNEIAQITASTFGSNYYVAGYKVMDSIVTRGVVRDFNSDPYTDPYGTLRHVVMFWVDRERPASFYTNVIGNSNDTTIVCFEKHGRLIWHSGSEIIGDVGSLMCCYDLNKDRNVDIGLIVHEFQKSDYSLLYLISWNGRNGEFINDVTQSGESVIVSQTGDLFDVFDIDGRGVYAIRGCWAVEGEPGSGWFPANNPSSTAPYVTYTWNGRKYGYWPASTQVPGYEFLPENRIKIDVRCSVDRLNGNFKYSYSFKNDPSSLQLADDIYIADIDSTGTTAFGPWTGSYSWVLNSYRWTTINVSRSQMLKVGEEISGFGFLSSEPPAVKRVYVQGFAPLGDVANEQRTDEAIINNVDTNSYSTYTLGPGLASQESCLASIDTLASYKHQCVTLGWLTNGPEHEKDEDGDKADEGIVERLDRRLDKAKDGLTRRDSVKAKLELELFVKEVERIYHKNKEEGERRGVPVLTSEGYALLKYNAEYLIDRLPEKEGKHEMEQGKGKK